MENNESDEECGKSSDVDEGLINEEVRRIFSAMLIYVLIRLVNILFL